MPDAQKEPTPKDSRKTTKPRGPDVPPAPNYENFLKNQERGQDRGKKKVRK